MSWLTPRGLIEAMPRRAKIAYVVVVATLVYGVGSVVLWCAGVPR